MRRIIYSAVLSMIVVAGLFIGMFKGQEERQRWVAKMKNRQEEKRETEVAPEPAEVMLDEIEMATYHS